MRSPREPLSPGTPEPRGSRSWRARVAPRSRGSPPAAGGYASRPPSRARRSSGRAARHRARSRARGTSPPSRPRSGMRFRRKPVCRSSVTSVDRLGASPSTIQEEGPRVDYLSCNAGGIGRPANLDRVAVQTEQEPQTAGELIRFWRTRRGLSQLQLSLDANVSTKHVSFVETGRSSPSRQLLVHLAQHLDLPIAERNRLLLAGGFAPPYLELPYDGEVMQPLRESLERLLEAHEPNPALIVDGLWNVIDSNRAASLLWDGVDPALLEPPINMLRLGVHPGGLPRISSMTAACNAPLIHRLKRRSREDADPALAKLIEEVESYLPGEPPAGQATEPVVLLRLQTRLGEVKLFTVIATLGAPLDVTAANLAIETFLPMDPESAARLAELSASRSSRKH